MMIDCSTIQPDLKAYADGELPVLRRLQVRAHLAHCASCRQEIIDMAQITEDLRAADEATLDPALRERILATPQPPLTGGAEHPVPPELGARGRPRRNPTLAWGIAGALLLAWFVFFPVFAPVREKARQVSTTPPYRSQVAGAPAMSANPSFAPPSLASRPFAPLSLANPVEVPARQVHKEATITVEVANPEIQGDDIAQMVKTAGGFVANNTLTTGNEGLRSADLTVKVPVAQFDATLAQIAKLGNVKAKNVIGEDITEQTSDADQAENVLEDQARRSAARLKQLGQGAGWRDQQDAREVRVELAQARARLTLLRKMAQLSTITADLDQTPQAKPPVQTGFLSNLKTTTHDALGSFLNSTGALLALVIWMLAYAPIWVPIAFGVRYAVRRSQGILASH